MNKATNQVSLWCETIWQDRPVWTIAEAEVAAVAVYVVDEAIKRMMESKNDN
jgi:hypothetical protein